jgi:hybrid cluster-associated redox disulfide protein
MKVEKEMLIKDIVKMGPEAMKILLSFGMGCIGCPASQNESIGEAATVHGINLENLLESLNNIDKVEA